MVKFQMFELIYEHQDFLVIQKYAGISVHKDDQATSLLLEVGKQTGDKHLYLIHRLDKMTSGLLLLGRNQQAASTLSHLFSERKVNKYYVALASKKPKKKQGAVKGDMAKSRRGAWKLLPSLENPALTQFFSQGTDNGLRYFLCKPWTGKTHQIRVALKSVGAPILGDLTYGGDPADRGYLHAYGLAFVYQGKSFAFLLPQNKGSTGRNYQSIGNLQMI